MGGSVPSSITKIDSAEKGDFLVNNDALFVVWPQRDPVGVAKNLYKENNINAKKTWNF